MHKTEAWGTTPLNGMQDFVACLFVDLDELRGVRGGVALLTVCLPELCL